MGKCPGSAITLPTGIGYDREKDEWTVTDEIWRVQEAFRLIERDPDLSLEHHRLTKLVLQERWKGRLELASIG